MKYTVYYKGDKVKLFNGDYNYVVNMYKEANASSCSVDTGGDIILSNGDILHINEQYGPLNYEANTNGIGLALESGNDIVALLTIGTEQAFTSHNCFFDIWRNGKDVLYQDKNLLTIYQAPELWYQNKNSGDGDYDIKRWLYLHESFSYLGTILLNKNKWELISYPVFRGRNFYLQSAEKIYISGLLRASSHTAIYYTRSSGAQSLGYYISSPNDSWRQTVNDYQENSYTGYFAPVYLQNGDEIHIYNLTEEDIYDVYTEIEKKSWDLDHGIPEEATSKHYDLLCTFKIVNNRWTLEQDYSTYSHQVCSVDTGGDFGLKNNDILYINEKYGLLTHGPYGEEDGEFYGIELSLESGHEFMAVLLMPSQSSWQTQMSIYGTFFDIGAEYEEGNIIHIYDLSAYDSYEDLGDNGYSNEHEFLSHPGVVCNAVLVLQENNWVLTNDPYYLGQSLTLHSGEEIYISGPMAEYDDIGLYFTLSSGRTSLALYYDASQRKYTRHSSYNWLAPTPAANGDYIYIFLYYEGEDYSQYTGDYDFHELDFDTAAQFTKHLCTLQRVNNQWKIVKDNS